MSDRQIVISARDATPRLALLEDDRPVELRLFPESARPFAGELLAARVISIAKEINAAFLLSDAGELLLPFEKAKAGTGKKTRSISDCVREGESVAVRVIRESDPRDAKLAMVRLMPAATENLEDGGLASLIANMAEEANASIIIDERTLYLAVKRLVGEGREVTLWTGQDDIFEAFGVQEVIDEATGGALALASGGSLRIEETLTLTAVDVNTGRADRGRPAARTRLKVNIEAAEKIAWGLRFLDIGGLVVIDFTSMNTKADRNAVLEALDDALAGDFAKVERSGFSRFGLVELARQRRGPSVLQRMARA